MAQNLTRRLLGPREARGTIRRNHISQNPEPEVPAEAPQPKRDLPAASEVIQTHPNGHTSQLEASIAGPADTVTSPTSAVG